MKGLALISLAILFLATILSESVVQSKCRSIRSGKVCEKICCGENLVNLQCLDSCVGVQCSSDDECGAGCCSHGVCTRSCPLIKTIIWFVLGTIVLLTLLCAPFAAVCWCRRRDRRATNGLVISTTLTRNGQLVARDDSIPLMTAGDREEFSEERRQEPGSTATCSHEVMVHGHDGPPPDYQA